MRPVNTLIVACTLVLLALFVWPTRFRYGTTSVGNEQVMTRSDRLTGRTQMLLGVQWTPVEENDPSPSRAAPTSLPPSELAKVTGTANAPMGTMYLNLYNGSSWQVTGVVIQVIGLGAHGDTLWQRSYRTPISIEPLHSSISSFTFTHDPMMRRFEWFLESAEGYGKR
jgi:hypothetical protein